MYLGRLKGCPGEIPAAADFNNLFQLGSSVLAPSGNISDLISDINKDYWDIQKQWSHKVGFAGYNGTGAIASSQYFNNNDYKLNVIKRLDITKYVQKTLKFNDSNNTTSGKNLFFFFQTLNAGGGTNGSTVLPCNINYWIDINMKMLKQRTVHYITSNSYYIIYFKEASHGVQELTKRMYSHPEKECFSSEGTLEPEAEGERNPLYIGPHKFAFIN